MSFRLPLALLAPLALVACGAGGAPSAPAPTPDSLPPQERLVRAIETEGCVLTRDNVGAVLLRANLTQADLPGLTSALQAEGRLEAAGGDAIRIQSQNCI
jgi:hypothetical protein